MSLYQSDKALDYIRKKILSGEYPPGHPLVPDVLCREIGASRTPVRDALRMLQADGLVVVRSGESASVAKMGLTEFHETCLLRLALEGHAAERAALNRTEEDLRGIRFALDAMRALSERILATPAGELSAEDLLREDREDIRFHIGIITAARNRLLKREILRLHLLGRVMARTTAFKPLAGGTEEQKRVGDERRRVVLASHETIFQAIAAGDPGAARKAMEAHLQDAVDQSMRELAQAEDDLTGRDLTEEEMVYTT